MDEPIFKFPNVSIDYSGLFIQHASDVFDKEMKLQQEQRSKAFNDACTGRLEMWVNTLKQHGIDPQDLKEVQKRCSINQPAGFWSDENKGSLVIDGQTVLEWTDKFKTENIENSVTCSITTTYKRYY